MVKMTIKGKLDEAHRNTGKGLAILLLPILAGVFMAASPAGQRAKEAVKQYISKKVVMPGEYNKTTDISYVAGYQDKHFYNNRK